MKRHASRRIVTESSQWNSCQQNVKAGYMSNFANRSATKLCLLLYFCVNVLEALFDEQFYFGYQ